MNPSTRTVPAPPVTPGQLIQARTRRSIWPVRLLGAGVAAIAVNAFTADLTLATPEQQQLVNIAQQWAAPAAVVLLLVGAGWWLLEWSNGESSSAAIVRVTAAAAAGLHLTASQVRLTNVRWRRGPRRRLRRGPRILLTATITYPTGVIVSDQSSDLAAALAPFTAGFGAPTARWQPHRDSFHVATPPPAAPQIQDTYTTVGTLAKVAQYLLGELVVDQQRTEVDDNTGAVIRFVATYPHTTRDTAESFRLRLKYLLDAKAPCPTGYWMVQLDPSTNTLTVSPSQPLPTAAALPLTDISGRNRDRLAVGVGAGDTTAWWEPAVHPHMLLVGPTGSGKTILINSLIEQAAARGWLIDLFDPKELSYRGFMPGALRDVGLPDWPGIHRVATSESEMEEGIDELYEELRSRYCQLKVFGVTEQQLQPRIAIIDEAGELVERLNAWHTSEEKYTHLVEAAIAAGRNPDSVAKPKGTRNPLLLKVWSLLRLGRQAKIYVVTGTQRPDVTFIPGEARANLTARVAMGKQDGAALDMVFNTRLIQQRVHETVVDPMTGEKTLRRIRGRATADLGDGPVSVQTFWTPDPSKLITGELSAADQALVRRQATWVAASAAGWDGTGDELRTIPIPVSLHKPELVGRKTEMVTRALDFDLGKPADTAVVEPPPADSRPARTLAAGDTARLEIDGHDLAVEIVEVEDEPTYLEEPGEVHELQVTYRITEGPHAGDLGVTTLADDERIMIDA